MWKSIYKQLWNRRRRNIWILVELLLVFCLVWYIVDFFFVMEYNKNIPNYRDVNHTFKVNIRIFPEDHPEYNNEAGNGEAMVANYERILNHIRSYPGVEAVAVTQQKHTPGGGNYRGINIYNPRDSMGTYGGQLISTSSQEDYFRVFGITTDEGKRPASIKDYDWGIPDGIVINRKMEELLFSNQQSAVGQKVKTPDDKEFQIIGIVDNTKRFSFNRIQHTVYTSFPKDSSSIRYSEISIRIQESLSDNKFREQFLKDMTGQLRIGNFYLLNIIPYQKIADDMFITFGVANKVNSRRSMLLFYLLSILLCVMGTFWYRVNLRREEIGVRIAIGSTPSGIRTLLFMEGLCLLSIITLPALILEYQYVHAGLLETFGANENNDSFGYLPDRTLLRFLITNLITWVIMAVIVSAAIWLPALKASSMQPAEALHYE